MIIETLKHQVTLAVNAAEPMIA